MINTRNTTQKLGTDQTNSIWRDSGGYKWQHNQDCGWQMWNGKTWNGSYTTVESHPPYFEITQLEPPPQPAQTPLPQAKPKKRRTIRKKEHQMPPDDAA